MTSDVLLSCLLSLLSLTNSFWRASSVKEVQEPMSFLFTKTLSFNVIYSLLFHYSKRSPGWEEDRMGDRTPNKPAGFVHPCPDLTVLSSCRTIDISILS